MLYMYMSLSFFMVFFSYFFRILDKLFLFLMIYHGLLVNIWKSKFNLQLSATWKRGRQENGLILNLQF